MRATSAMTRDVVCIQPTDSLSDAYQIMTEWEIRHLPVLEGSRLVGILSDRDVLVNAHTTPGGLAVDDMTVAEAMTPDPMTCRANADVAAIGSAMTRHKVDSMPVVDEDGELIGLVTSTDLIEILISREESQAARALPFRFQVRAAVRPAAAARV